MCVLIVEDDPTLAIDLREYLEERGDLPEQALVHIFERRYRTAASPGLGIGLYLVYRICDRQGWLIQATSEQGAGTSINIQLEPEAA